MATCNGCGGIVGRDCFNPSECEWIARDMERREAMQQAESVARDVARDAMNAGQTETISLRDAMATHAMAAMVASREYVEGGWDQADIAKQAYQMADAMLKARTQDASHE